MKVLNSVDNIIPLPSFRGDIINPHYKILELLDSDLLISNQILHAL